MKKNSNSVPFHGIPGRRQLTALSIIKGVSPEVAAAEVATITYERIAHLFPRTPQCLKERARRLAAVARMRETLS